MNKRRLEIYDDSDYTDMGEFSEPRKTKKTSEFEDMKGAAFRDFLKSVGLTAKDEKMAMKHLNSFLSYSRSEPEEEEEEEGEGSRWYEDDRPEGYDKKQLKEKSKVLKYTNSAYDDDDEDYLKDRLQQNEQYYTKR